MTLYYAAVFILGLLVGSFLNVVIARFNTGETITRGRSMCFSCGKILHWYELVPIASFLIQRGRCRGCGSAISWQYPLVELLTGIIFLAVISHAALLGQSMIVAAYFLIVFSLLVVISVYDLRHKIIPDRLVYTLIVLSAVKLAFPDLAHFTAPGLWDVFAGPLYFAPFAALWLFSRGTWMGLGDAKLAWAIGWLLGVGSGGVAIILAFWVGAIIGLLAIFVNKMGLFRERGGLTMRSEIPFGPFLAIGTLFVWLYQISFPSFVAFFTFVHV